MSIYVDNKRLITQDELGDVVSYENRNLYRNTLDFSGDYWKATAAENQIDPDTSDNWKTPSGYLAYKCSDSWTGIFQPISVIANQYYTYSGYIAFTKATMDYGINIYSGLYDTPNMTDQIIFKYNGNTQSTNNWHFDNVFTGKANVDVTWHKFEITVHTNNSGILALRIENNVSGVTNYMGELKLEHGAVATPYSPSPEDILSEIQQLKNKIGGVAKPCYINAYREYATPVKEAA